LTQIRGVSAALSARLNELGVYTYRQIAAWDENQVREFSQRLAFKDRITREQWIQQARGLNEARNQTLDLADHPQQHLSDGAS
jgi:predicted flap endonuclease-1-like 5' DNA nuclease